MNPVSFQSFTSRPQIAVRANTRFSGWWSGKKKQTDTVEKTASSGKFIQGSIGKGITRALKMTFLRPRGWAELALTIGSGWIVNFPVIHFIEGLVGADSIWMKRRLAFGIVTKNKEFGGRTLVGAFKDFYQSFPGLPFLKKK